jgi:hypothetical protein
VEDAGHHIINRQERVSVEGVNDKLLVLTERAGARNATQHEEAEVVGVYGRGSINHLRGLVVVIERLPHEIELVSK